MTIDSATQIFFDSSCLIAAAGNPSGGSGFILSLCARGYLLGVVSQPVLLEARRNIQGKLGDAALQRMEILLATTSLLLARLPSEPLISNLEESVNKKDTHVLAAALTANVPFILTLDKQLIDQINSTKLGVRAYLPGDFIKQILPTHINYPPE
jgi:predicted nucleic acid-binding protein